jgi:hypothetical protein
VFSAPGQGLACGVTVDTALLRRRLTPLPADTNTSMSSSSASSENSCGAKHGVQRAAGGLGGSQKALVNSESEGAFVDPSTLIQRDMFGQSDLMSLLSRPTRQHKIKLNIN